MMPQQYLYIHLHIYIFIEKNQNLILKNQFILVMIDLVNIREWYLETEKVSFFIH